MPSVHMLDHFCTLLESLKGKLNHQSSQRHESIDELSSEEEMSSNENGKNSAAGDDDNYNDRALA